MWGMKSKYRGYIGETDNRRMLEVLLMPLLSLLPSHHEDRVNLHMPFTYHMEGLIQVPIAPLFHQARRPAPVATDSERRKGERHWRKNLN